MSIRRHVWVRAAIALAVSVLVPYIELAWKCRVGFETSEACVWGRSFLPLMRWVEPLIIAPIVFVLLSIISHHSSRKSP